MTLMERVDAYLTDARTFYLATCDGDQPKCRPMGLHLLINDTIYFGGAIQKNMVQQMLKNPKVEFVATGKDMTFLRLYGEITVELNTGVTDYILEKNPGLKKMYEDMGLNMAAFHFEHGTVEFRNLMSIKEKAEF